MRTLYLLRPHGTAGIDGEQLVVSSGEQELDRMALPLLDQILVMGHLQLTTQLIRACLRRGIPIAYLTSGGQCLGRLQPLDGGYRHRARRQAELPEAQRLAVARTLVASKIANGRVVLLRFTRRGGRPIVEATLRRLGQLQALTAKAPSSNHLRGLEGAAAAQYFRSLGSLREGDGFGFAVRSRRPPRTPFDALCGFGYGVLWNALLLRVGSARHAALVSDLIEPLRTYLVDPFHGQLIRSGQMRAEQHFEPSAGGVYLSEAGRRLWLQAWSAFMAEPIRLGDGSTGPRWELLDQLVQSFARFVDDPDQPLLVPLRR
ncbi:CRISPR-associated endonuclease Cas1 [Aphanothece minutissima]|nr:CRISPR-associated endonuclease Cas1 [Aphanothece minutissima]